MSDFQKRRLKYKSHPSPLAWKDAYREKCFERLRTRRASLIEKFRHPKELVLESTSPAKIVSDVMELEWNALSPNRRFPSLNFGSDFENAEDEMIEALLQIQKELQSEEEMRINEFLLHESSELDSKVQMLLFDDVICPLCQKGKLEETTFPTLGNHLGPFVTPPRRALINSVKAIKCSCGLFLSNENGVRITLEQVRETLHNTMNKHNSECNSTLNFCATEDNGGTNILVTCSSCDWMSFIL